jgi:hypothetical protein
MLGNVMRATLSYTILRLLMFFAALIALYFAGARGFLLLILAALVSAVASFFALFKLRDRMSGSLSKRVTGFRERLDEGTKAEDID